MGRPCTRGRLARSAARRTELGGLCIGLSLLGTLLGASPARASCDTIPMRVRYYPSVDASIDRPFGSPDDVVTVIRQAPGVFTGQERVTFVVGNTSPRKTATYTCGEFGFACTPSSIGNESRLAITLPEIEESEVPVAGPTEITVTSALGTIVATIKELTVAAAPADKPSSVAYDSGKFTLLPRAKKIPDTQPGNSCEQTEHLWAALDANGNVLVPLDKPTANPVTNAAILELGHWRRLSSTPDLPARVRAFTAEGRPLPPIVIGGADSTVSGIAKPERRSVLRILSAALPQKPTAAAPYLAVDFDDGSKTQVRLNACSTKPVPLASFRTGARIIAYPEIGTDKLLVGSLASSAVCQCPTGALGGKKCINSAPPGSRPTLTAGEDIAACLVAIPNPPRTPLRIVTNTNVERYKGDGGFSSGDLVDGNSVVIRRDRALGILSPAGLRSAYSGAAGGYRDYLGVTSASVTVTRALAARGDVNNAQLIDLTAGTGGEKDLGSPATKVALGDSAGAWTEPKPSGATATSLRLLDKSQVQAPTPTSTKESISGDVLQLAVWDRFVATLVTPNGGGPTRLQVFDSTATAGSALVIDCRASGFIVGQERDDAPATLAFVVGETAGDSSPICSKFGDAASANPAGNNLNDDTDSTDLVVFGLVGVGSSGPPRVKQTRQSIHTTVPPAYAWMAPYRAYGAVLHFLTNEAEQNRDLDGDTSIDNKLVQQLFDLNDPQGVSPNLGYPAPQLAGVQIVDVVDPAAADAQLFPQESTDQTILVAQQCTIVPPSAISASESGYQLFGDVEEDGTLDAFDNCPEVRNPRQIDLDLDGMGDGPCDADLCAAPAAPIRVSGFPSQLTAHAGKIAEALGSYSRRRLEITNQCLQSEPCLPSPGVDPRIPLAGPGRAEQCRGSFVRDDEILPPWECTASPLQSLHATTQDTLENILDPVLHTAGHPETQRKARALVRITAEATDAISRARHGEYENGVSVIGAGTAPEMNAEVIAQRVHDVLRCCLSRAHDHGASGLDACVDANPGSTSHGRPTNFLEWLGERFSCRLLQPRPLGPFGRPAGGSSAARSTFACVENRQLAAICERSALTLAPRAEVERMECNAGSSAPGGGKRNSKTARAGS